MTTAAMQALLTANAAENTAEMGENGRILDLEESYRMGSLVEGTFDDKRDYAINQ